MGSRNIGFCDVRPIWNRRAIIIVAGSGIFQQQTELTNIKGTVVPNHHPRLVEIENIFKAQPCTIAQFLNVPGRCFFVPPYQRDFDWSNQNISRFFEDACHGWSQLDTQELTATFLGSIIAVLSSSREDFSTDAQQSLPAQVSAIVDGQQRLTTLLMTCVGLHDTLSKLNQKIVMKTQSGEVWIRDLVANILNELLPMIEQQMAGGDAPHNYYPRLLRRPEDQWGTREQSARYGSPIARLINGYSAFARTETSTAFKPDLPQVGASGRKAHEALTAAYAHVKKCLGDIAKGQRTFEVPPLELIATSVQMQYALTGAEFPEFVRDRLAESIRREQEGKRDSIAKLLRLAMFSRYLCRRVAVTLINAMNEEYAFDIFECLNTTGEPLTAYQTFKPKVVGRVGYLNWESSDEKKRLDVVEEYLRKFNNPQARQKKTAELLTTFALFESGFKLPYRLSEQRLWMQRRFEALEDVEGEQAEFIRGLSTIASFMSQVWPADARKRSEIVLSDSLLDVARLCLGVLRQAQHTIVIPLIGRFYGEWHRASAEDKDKAADELVKTLKAVAAFWVVWRLSRRSTGGIDDFYRSLMSNGFARKPADPSKLSRPLVSDDIRRELVDKLKSSGVANRTAWVKAVTQVPAYQAETAATRLALIAAMHDTVPDLAAPGLWQLGRLSTFDALTFSMWSGDDTATLEHVAPQKKGAGDGWDWSEQLYEEEDTINLLGNLVLFPGDTNSSLGNQAWRYKRAVYGVLASTRDDEFDAAMASVAADGIQLSDSTKQFLQNHKHLRQMQAFANLPGPWDKEAVLKRTENLAELAWERLSTWIGFSESDGDENVTLDQGNQSRVPTPASDEDEDLLADDDV
jgi:hypothetical protein